MRTGARNQRVQAGIGAERQELMKHIWASPDETPESPEDFVCDDGHPWGPRHSSIQGLVNVYHTNWRLKGFDYVCVTCGERTHREPKPDPVLVCCICKVKLDDTWYREGRPQDRWSWGPDGMHCHARCETEFARLYPHLIPIGRTPRTA